MARPPAARSMSPSRSSGQAATPRERPVRRRCHDLRVHQLGDCWRGWTGEATLTGDIEGTAIFDMAANLEYDPAPGEVGTNLATFNATYLVHGSVTGCGTGEFMIVQILQFVAGRTERSSGPGR